MNKLYILVVMLLMALSFSITGGQDVKAAGTVTTIEWYFNTTSAELAMEALIVFDDTAHEVSFLIPESDLYSQDNGVHVFDFTFYDELDVQIEYMQAQDMFGFEIGSTDLYVLNFDRLEIEDVASVLVSIPILFNIPLIDIPEGFLGYVNDTSTVTVDYANTPFGFFDFLRVFSGDSYVSTFESQKITMPSETEFLTLASSVVMTLRLSPANKVLPVFNSEIYFYDDNDVLLDTIVFSEIAVANRVDDLTANILRELYIDISTVTDFEDIDSFSVRRVATQGDPNILNYLNSTAFYDFDGNGIFTVNYVSENEVHETFKTIKGAILAPRELDPVPTDPNKEFAYWILQDGLEYKGRVLTSTDFLDGVITLYAVFEEIPNPVNLDATDPNVDNESIFVVGFNKLGFNDPIERTLVFAAVIVITGGLLFWRKIPAIAVIAVIGCELIFFMYLGLLPLFVSIIVLLVLVFLTLAIRGGVASNE